MGWGRAPGPDAVEHPRSNPTPGPDAVEPPADWRVPTKWVQLGKRPRDSARQIIGH